jgi:choline transport protein
MVGFIAVVCVLGVMSTKHSATYVFTEFSNTSGWDNDGVSWLVGLLSAVYPFLGYEISPGLRELIVGVADHMPQL